MALTPQHEARRKSKRKRFKRKSKYVGKAFYEGPSKSKVKQSARQLILDQLAQSSLPVSTDSRQFTRVLHAMNNFIDEIFSQMKNLSESSESKSLADSCKEQFSRSEQLVDSCIAHIFNDELELTGLIRPHKSDKLYWMEKVYYLPREYDVLFYDEEEDILKGIYHVKPASLGYEWLNQSLILMMGLFYERTDALLEDDYIKIDQLLRAMLSFGALFQQMNPDDQTLDKYADDSIDELESEIDAKLPDEFWELWKEFLKDLEEGKEPYVRECARALRLSESYRNSPFNDDDYYISNKATSRVDARYKGIRQSILASGFEECHHEDDIIVKEAEALIGYTCHYNPDEGNQPKKDMISREIRNPGKFKPRLIIIGDNEIQDLACYIKNRYKDFTSRIPSSCTDMQEKGLTFGLKITNPLYVEHYKNNVYNWDWEDCTNNILWEFDDLVFGLVLPKLVPLWQWLRSQTKYHKYATRGREDRSYNQKGKGQPQGLGGSFDDMDWFHIVISMLTMLLSGRKKVLLSDFLADLGDDDATNTVLPDEIDYDNPLYKDEPGFRTKVQLAFRKICSWVNLKINDSKCIFNEYTEEKRKPYEYEFAKVRIRNGKFCSPIPPRIASKYYLTAYQLIALTWELKHGWTSQNFIETILEREFSPGEDLVLAKILYRSGCVHNKTFDMYVDSNFEVDIRAKALVKAAYYISAMRTSAIFGLIPDGKKQFGMFSYKEELDSFKSLVNSKQVEEIWMGIRDPDHKFNKLLDKNEEVLSVIKGLYGLEDRPAMFAGLLLITDRKVRSGFRAAQSLMRLLPYWGDQTEDYFEPQIVLNLDCSDIDKACDLLLFKSSRKRGAQDLVISHKAVQEAKKLLDFFPQLREELSTNC